MSALVVGDVVQLRLVREIVDLHRAEVRPVELERVAHLAAVGGDDEAADAAGVEDLAQALLAHALVAHPEVVELVAELVGLRQGAGVEIGVGGHLLPAPARGPVGDVGQRRRVAPLDHAAAVGDQRAEERVGRVTHLFRQRLDAAAGGLGQARVVAQGQGNRGDVHLRLHGDIRQGNAFFAHLGVPGFRRAGRPASSLLLAWTARCLMPHMTAKCRPLVLSGYPDPAPLNCDETHPLPFSPRPAYRLRGHPLVQPAGLPALQPGRDHRRPDDVRPPALLDRLLARVPRHRRRPVRPGHHHPPLGEGFRPGFHRQGAHGRRLRVLPEDPRAVLVFP